MHVYLLPAWEFLNFAFIIRSQVWTLERQSSNALPVELVTWWMTSLVSFCFHFVWLYLCKCLVSLLPMPAGWCFMDLSLLQHLQQSVRSWLTTSKFRICPRRLEKGRPGIWLVLWWVQSPFHSTSAPVSFVRAIKGNSNRWYTSQFLIQSCHFHSARWKLAIFRLFLPSLKIKAKLLNWTHGGTLAYFFFILSVTLNWNFFCNRRSFKSSYSSMFQVNWGDICKVGSFLITFYSFS